MKNKYVIGTGWWCNKDNSGLHAGSKEYTSPETRKAEFFDFWYKSIKQNTNPEKIIIIDSNSPTKPDYKKYNDDRIEWINLNKN